MRVTEYERYLGDFLGNSLSESVFKTIQSRKGLTMRLISEIKVTVEDYRANSVGGILVGLKIWEQAVIPYLFANSSCWMETPKKAINLLNSIQRDFFRSLFLQAKGCPIPLFLYDTASLSAENIIILNKLLFISHLCHLPDSSLAKEVYILQKEQSLHEGLVTECDKHLRELNIFSGPEFFSKKAWKKLILQRLHKRNEEQLLSQIETYKKLDFEKLSKEGYGIKPYLADMTVSRARTFFSARASMLSTVKLNFKNKKEYADKDFLCECGEHPDDQAALLTCNLYAHLREGLNLHTSDHDIVTYYQRVIKERHDRENEINLRHDS